MSYTPAEVLDKIFDINKPVAVFRSSGEIIVKSADTEDAKRTIKQRPWELIGIYDQRITYGELAQDLAGL